jgi:hypothetical protein
MAVDIELACNSIQALIRTNMVPTLIQNAPDMEHYATALHDAQCPYVMTWPSDGSWHQKGHGYKVDERMLTIFCFVESLAQKDIPSRVVQGTRLLQAMRNLFLVPANIDLTNINTTGYQVTIASRFDQPQTDTGLRADLPYTGASWFGFSIPLKVRIQWIV